MSAAEDELRLEDLVAPYAAASPEGECALTLRALHAAVAALFPYASLVEPGLCDAYTQHWSYGYWSARDICVVLLVWRPDAALPPALGAELQQAATRAGAIPALARIGGSPRDAPLQSAQHRGLALLAFFATQLQRALYALCPLEAVSDASALEACRVRSQQLGALADALRAFAGPMPNTYVFLDSLRDRLHVYGAHALGVFAALEYWAHAMLSPPDALYAFAVGSIPNALIVALGRAANRLRVRELAAPLVAPPQPFDWTRRRLKARQLIAWIKEWLAIEGLRLAG